MADTALISSIDEWLIDQALDEPDMLNMFSQMCDRIQAIGVPIARAMVTWTTLHPLINAEQAIWQRDKDTQLSQFEHQTEESEGWLLSPIRFMLDSDVDLMRRPLAGPDSLLDFPLLTELAERGFTDYLATTVGFHMSNSLDGKETRGLVITWATDRPGGFTNNHVKVLQRLKKHYALASKMAIQARITRNITETYLGRHAASKVLAGQIRHGDGDATQAIVWYSDLRNSTALADTMPREIYAQLLNAYYQCTAGAAIEAGGEILDFIGDGVLAIFPIEPDAGIDEAATAAVSAVGEALHRLEAANQRRAQEGDQPFEFGIGLNRGEVMFGNIGVPERLTFSVIGPTVNEVARIEKMNKSLGRRALATSEIIRADPGNWVSTGHHRLVGVSEPVELFAWQGPDGAPKSVGLIQAAARVAEAAVKPPVH